MRYSIERACDLILELAGGTLIGKRVQIGSVDKALESIEFSPDAMRSFIGFSVEDTEVQSVFESLNFEVDTSSESAWQITPPTYRRCVSSR